MKTLKLRAKTEKVFLYMVNKWWLNLRTGCYGDICRDVLKDGADGLTAGRYLGEIERACIRAGIPQLNLICCNGRTLRPGKWAYASNQERQWRDGVLAVYDFDWVNDVEVEVIPEEETVG